MGRSKLRLRQWLSDNKQRRALLRDQYKDLQTALRLYQKEKSEDTRKKLFEVYLDLAQFSSNPAFVTGFQTLIIPHIDPLYEHTHGEHDLFVASNTILDEADFQNPFESFVVENLLLAFFNFTFATGIIEQIFLFKTGFYRSCFSKWKEFSEEALVNFGRIVQKTINCQNIRRRFHDFDSFQEFCDIRRIKKTEVPGFGCRSYKNYCDSYGLLDTCKLSENFPESSLSDTDYDDVSISEDNEEYLTFQKCNGCKLAWFCSEECFQIHIPECPRTYLE